MLVNKITTRISGPAKGILLIAWPVPHVPQARNAFWRGEVRLADLGIQMAIAYVSWLANPDAFS